MYNHITMQHITCHPMSHTLEFDIKVKNAISIIQSLCYGIKIAQCNVFHYQTDKLAGGVIKHRDDWELCSNAESKML